MLPLHPFVLAVTLSTDKYVWNVRISAAAIDATETETDDVPGVSVADVAVAASAKALFLVSVCLIIAELFVLQSLDGAGLSPSCRALHRFHVPS